MYSSIGTKGNKRCLILLSPSSSLKQVPQKKAKPLHGATMVTITANQVKPNSFIRNAYLYRSD